MKVILFGGEGFIGKHFQNFLKQEEHEIISCDIVTSSSSKYCDVRKPIISNDFFTKDDVIINLAAIHKTPGHPDFEYFETNIKGAENVCAFAEEKGINNIIFTSSIAPYGSSEELKNESNIPTPNTPYGISKLTAEYIHKTWAIKDPKRKLLIIRPGVVFGKGENGNYTRLYKAIKSGKFFYPGRKDTIKACIYVKELISLSWKILNSFSSGEKTYNFTYEPAPSIKEIVHTISSVIEKKPSGILINGRFLLFVAHLLKIFGFGKLGIHPDRVKKLMISTRISGEKLLKDQFDFKYTLKSAIEDWYIECDKKGLF